MNTQCLQRLHRVVLAWLLVNLAPTVTAAQPTIDSQPQSLTVMLYQPAAFGVIASPGATGLSYQWLKDGVPIAGATNDQIVLAQARFSDVGVYSVVVSNAESSVTSTNAELTVKSPSAGDLDYSFAWGGSINNLVRSIAMQLDGRVLIGGEFSRVNGAFRGKVARLNTDGSTDYTFMSGLPGANSSVYSLALQRDGKVIIGGQFSAIHGVTRNGVARLNADGSLDTGFQNLFSGVEWVYALAVQSDDKVLIAGNFWEVNGVSRHGIARLNADGTLDSSFQDGLSGAAGGVYSVAMQADGKVLIGGLFSSVNGVSRRSVARLNPDGTLDGGFQNGLPGANDAVHSMAVQPDGKILLGGRFNTVNGSSRNRIARLNPDGSLDTSFQNGLGGAGPFLTASVESVAVQRDGKVLIGGQFSTLNGVTCNGAARLNGDGSLDPDFQNGFSGVSVGVAPFDSPAVYVVVAQSDGKVLIGGLFMRVNGASRHGIGRLHADGTLDDSFRNGISQIDTDLFNDFYANANSVAVQSDGKAIIGGRFTSVNGVKRNAVARLNTDGTLDPDFQNGLSGVDNDVYSVALHSDGKVLIGGAFTNVNGVGRKAIARLNADGTLDQGFQNGLSGFDGMVYSVVAQRDGKVLAGGRFSAVNGESRKNIARLNADGTLDSDFQTAVVGDSVWEIVVQSDDKVLIGGDFDLVNDQARNHLARLNVDGTLDTGFHDGLFRINDAVYSLAVQGDGKVFIGGSFTNVDGVSRNRLARLNADGTLDNAFLNGLSGANGNVASIAVQRDGAILIGGPFTMVNGENRNFIARLNADGTLDRRFQNGLSGVCCGSVFSVALQSDGNVLVGGYFTIVNGAPAVGFARLWGSDIPPLLKTVNRNRAGLELVWYAIPNRTYRVQSNGNLSENKWIDLAGDVSPEGATASKTDAALGAADQRFYRVMLLPQ